VGRPSLVAFALRRLLCLPIVLLFVMFVTFALVHGVGGSPFRESAAWHGPGRRALCAVGGSVRRAAAGR
jgi:hypothetical protein